MHCIVDKTMDFPTSSWWRVHVCKTRASVMHYLANLDKGLFQYLALTLFGIHTYSPWRSNLTSLGRFNCLYHLSLHYNNNYWEVGVTGDVIFTTGSLKKERQRKRGSSRPAISNQRTSTVPSPTSGLSPTESTLTFFKKSSSCSCFFFCSSRYSGCSGKNLQS